MYQDFGVLLYLVPHLIQYLLKKGLGFSFSFFLCCMLIITFPSVLFIDYIST